MSVKTFITVLLFAFAVWIAWNRQRVFIRDPLASVYRNDVKQNGVEVYFNFSNDVLLQQSSDPSRQRTILQHWNRAPGTPTGISCIRFLVCLTPDDHAPIVALAAEDAKHIADPQTIMNGRHIAFVDDTGARIRVEL